MSRINLTTFHKLPFLKKVVAKGSSREEYESAFANIVATKGAIWEKEILNYIFRLQHETILNQRMKRQKIQAEEDEHFKQEFAKHIHVGTRVWFKQNRKSQREFGIVIQVHGYNHVTVDVVKTRLSKTRLDDKGMPLIVPRFNKILKRIKVEKLYLIVDY